MIGFLNGLMSARKQVRVIMKAKAKKYSIMVREGSNDYDSEWMQVNSDPEMWVEELKSWIVGPRWRGMKRFSHVYWKQNHA
jgi:hypothetical protein